MSRICCREKAVLVAVYAERPRKLSGNGQGLAHHHHYHHFHQNVNKNGSGRGRGYNRRADLLDYARHLRASAQPSAPSNDNNSHIKHNSLVQTVSDDRKLSRNPSLHPTCLGKWKFLVPSFLKNTKDKWKKKKRNTASAATKMKALVKSLHVQKKGSLLSRLLATQQKRR